MEIAQEFFLSRKVCGRHEHPNETEPQAELGIEFGIYLRGREGTQGRCKNNKGLKVEISPNYIWILFCDFTCDVFAGK